MDQGAIDALVKLDMTSLTAFNIPLRLLLVVLFSGTLGWERTAKRRGAGIRTYIIVSLGAALTMMTSQFLKDYVADGYTDLSRLGAQVISGIGFIGAGTIMFNGFKQVKGITTAAGLWASACMGLAMGAGFVYGALIVWVLMFLVMTVLDTWENRFFSHMGEIRLFIVFESFQFFRVFMQKMKANGFVIADFEMDKTGLNKEIATYITLNLKKRVNHETVIDGLSSYPGILMIEEI
jgi:putative Mg2+ transporter-C (MgtC) family protein